MNGTKKEIKKGTDKKKKLTTKIIQQTGRRVLLIPLFRLKREEVAAVLRKIDLEGVIQRKELIYLSKFKM